MLCPRCGQSVGEKSDICPHCSFILDTAFLGDDILDDMQRARPGRGGIEARDFEISKAVELRSKDAAAQPLRRAAIQKESAQNPKRGYVSGQSKVGVAPNTTICAVDHDRDHGEVEPTFFESKVLKLASMPITLDKVADVLGLEIHETYAIATRLLNQRFIEVVGFAEDSGLAHLGATLVGSAPNPNDLPSLASVSPEIDITDPEIDGAFRVKTHEGEALGVDAALPSEEELADLPQRGVSGTPTKVGRSTSRES